MSHWQPGTNIQGGRYVITKVLGYGGSGVTYRAQEKHTGEWFAIKTLNALMQTRSDFSKLQERFVQEAFRLAKCTHPHVIRVDNICQEGSLWCMVMECISGGDLRQYAVAKGGIKEAEALRYIQQIGSALDYIHQQGFLHRDVKPANIMLRKQTMEAVLIDFGLAREFVQDEIQTHTNSRTESFAPIEQYEKRAKRGAYTDVYALAATLYYVLTLQLPFPAPFRRQGANLISPQQHNPQISDRVNLAILKGMELLPENRPSSIPAWLALLTHSSTTISSVPKRPPVQPPSTNSFTAAPMRSVPPPPPSKPVPVLLSLDTQETLAPSTPRVSTHQPTPLIDTSSPTVAPVQPISLVSLAGVDYAPLQQLLSQAKFKEADQETARMLLKLANREKAGWLDKVHVDNLPCEDLRTINQLWQQGSNGRFGFSRQKRIYQSLGGTLEHNGEIWKQFCDRVGWRQNNKMLSYKDLNFTLWAPEGHLPMLGLQIWGFTGWFSVLASRLEMCQI